MLLRFAVRVPALLVFLSLALGGVRAHAEDVFEVYRSQLGAPSCIALDAVDGSAWLGMGSSIVHLAADGTFLTQTNGFWIPVGLAVDPNDRSVWVADTWHDQIVHLDPTGKEMLREGVFWHPSTISVNPVDSTLWVVDSLHGEMVHLRKDGMQLSRTGGFDWGGAPTGAQLAAVDPSDGSCLVADAVNRRIVRLSAAATQVWELKNDGLATPWSIVLDPTDGSFWVSGWHNVEMAHFSKEGAELWHGGSSAGYSLLAVAPDSSLWYTDGAGTAHIGADGTPILPDLSLSGCLAVEPSDSSCWVASSATREVVRFAPDGTQITRVDVPPAPGAIAANAADGTCWVGLGGELAHLAPDAHELWRGGQYNANELVVNPKDGSVWVTEGNWVNGHVTHIAADGTELWRGDSFRAPYHVSLNLDDGSVWTSDQPANQVIHIAADGTELARLTPDLIDVSTVAVNPRDGSIWVGSDYALEHLTADGAVIANHADFYMVMGTAVDPRDGSVWVFDNTGERLTHLADDDVQLGQWTGFVYAGSLSISPISRSIWFSDLRHDSLLHIASTGAALSQLVSYSGKVAVSPRDSSVWVAQDQLVHLKVSWFADVPLANWASDAIGACAVAEIVGGYPDATYQPSDPLTRDQMAVYISRAVAGGDDKVPTGPATATFSDVPIDYWAFKYVEYAVDQDVVKGYSDGTYKPANQVTRDQMSVFIARAIATPTAGADLVNYTPPATATFPDVATSFWAYKYVEYIAQPAIGVTKGYPDGDYHPEYICTRDQMAVYVTRAFELPM
jgi:DNA-binding beta-propeller fold protein YncE